MNKIEAERLINTYFVARENLTGKKIPYDCIIVSHERFEELREAFDAKSRMFNFCEKSYVPEFDVEIGSIEVTIMDTEDIPIEGER